MELRKIFSECGCAATANEYLHLDLGSTTNMFSYQFGGFPFALSTSSSLRDDIVRAGLNYKFGFGPVVASY
jgi:hypothetical protein